MARKSPKTFLLAVAACLSLPTVGCASNNSLSVGGRDAARDSAGDRGRDGGTGGDGSIDAGPPSVTCTDGSIVANEMNDYQFSSTLTLPPVSVKPMSNLTFQWGGVTHDLLGHPISPTTDLNTIMLLVYDVPLAKFEMEAVQDTLSLGSLAATPPPTFLPTGGVTSANLFGDFGQSGLALTAANFDQYLNPTAHGPIDTTFVIAAQTGPNLGANIRTLQAFQLDPASTNTTVALTNSSATLQYAANLHQLHPTGVPAGTPAMTLDWSQLKTNALGTAFDPLAITTALVGHYTQTPAQLESQFSDLKTIATELYSANIYTGAVLDFTTLTDSAGKPFAGIDATGTWLVALIEGGTLDPAPRYLTILMPAPQPCN
jgi:hypothetical protein